MGSKIRDMIRPPHVSFQTRFLKSCQKNGSFLTLLCTTRQAMVSLLFGFSSGLLASKQRCLLLRATGVACCSLDSPNFCLLQPQYTGENIGGDRAGSPQAKHTFHTHFSHLSLRRGRCPPRLSGRTRRGGWIGRM